MSQKRLNVNGVVELARKHQIPLEQLLPTVERELTETVPTDEILRVPYRIGTTMYRSMAHASRFFRELRDNGRFYAGRCPRCGHTALPPAHAVCHRCIKQGRLEEYVFVDFGAEIEGTVLSWCRLVRGSTKHVGRGEVYPCVVRVDGSDIGMWQYVLPREGSSIAVGARVNSVLLPQEERTGEASDFAFRLI
jgi:uncharacterized OB-fold protein